MIEHGYQLHNKNVNEQYGYQPLDFDKAKEHLIFETLAQISMVLHECNKPVVQDQIFIKISFKKDLNPVFISELIK